tara:strand:- start:53163 stop:53987 length:825 start_codon:yes stop_codon:yes gene_type:complete
MCLVRATSGQRQQGRDPAETHGKQGEAIEAKAEIHRPDRGQHQQPTPERPGHHHARPGKADDRRDDGSDAQSLHVCDLNKQAIDLPQGIDSAGISIADDPNQQGHEAANHPKDQSCIAQDSLPFPETTVPGPALTQYCAAYLGCPSQIEVVSVFDKGAFHQQRVVAQQIEHGPRAGRLIQAAPGCRAAIQQIIAEGFGGSLQQRLGETVSANIDQWRIAKLFQRLAAGVTCLQSINLHICILACHSRISMAEPQHRPCFACFLQNQCNPDHVAR